MSSTEYKAHPKALVDEGAQIGPGTRIWAFAHVMPGATVGSGCNLCDYSFVESGAVLGNNVTIKNGVQVWEGVTLENGVFIGPNATFTNDRVPRTMAVVHREKSDWLEKTVLREGAAVGANATIVCGTTIGRYAFVAAGAVVTKDVPDYAIAMGLPARLVGWVCVCGSKLGFKAGAKAAKCSKCGRQYTKAGKPGAVKLKG